VGEAPATAAPSEPAAETPVPATDETKSEEPAAASEPPSAPEAKPESAGDASAATDAPAEKPAEPVGEAPASAADEIKSEKSAVEPAAELPAPVAPSEPVAEAPAPATDETKSEQPVADTPAPAGLPATSTELVPSSETQLTPAPAPQPEPEPEPEREFKPRVGFDVIPFKEREDLDDLYAYRKNLAQPPQAPKIEVKEEPKEKAADTASPQQAQQPGQPQQPEPPQPPKQPITRKTILVILCCGLLAILLLSLVLSSLMKPKPPVSYIDLGNRRLDSAGLTGRLIAHWEGKPTFQLFVDPIDPQQIANFHAVASNPPYPLTVTLRLKNASGIVVCQEGVNFPDANGQPLVPLTNPEGDAVQNIAGADGHISEIRIDGPLSCTQENYSNLTDWDFSSNFPSLKGMHELRKEEEEQKTSADSKKAASTANTHGPQAQVQRLPSTIEGDDVIVADNPARGIVETSSGRLFFVGKNGLHGRADWQTFPASIHYRCDKSGSCTLTRKNSGASLQVRLGK
jgi:chemotaxis protein histidine kinase CheA